MRANGLMVLSKQAVAVALALLLALAWVGCALQESGADVQSAGHADCDACHFRHLSVVKADGVPAPPELVPAVHVVAFVHAHGGLGMAPGIHPTRGPPA